MHKIEELLCKKYLFRLTMFFLSHETNTKNLLNILKVNILLKKSETQKLGLNNLQGRHNRRLSNDPKVSLSDSNFGDKFDEVDGVYFRLYKENTLIKPNYGGNCVLVFSSKVLTQKDFVVNTEENMGFCIAEDGVEALSQFSGEEGITVTTIKNLHLLNKYKFNHNSSEVVILDNVDLKYLKYVLVNSDAVDCTLINSLMDKNIPLKVI